MESRQTRKAGRWTSAASASTQRWPRAFMVAAGCCTGATARALEMSAALTGIHQDCCGPQQVAAADFAKSPSTETATTPSTSASDGPVHLLGIGDPVSVQVFGRPELNLTTYVADDGTIPLPLAGNVAIAGLSTAKAGQKVAAAFRQGGFLVDPQVTVSPAQFRGQQVSVLGAVRTPGRFVVESSTTVLDLLAQAGGTTENGGDVVIVLRPDRAGKVTRHAIDLKGLSHENLPLPTLTLRGGDTIFVPPSEQYYVTGEVHTPNGYRLEAGMTVLQAISRGGGVTTRGSSSRIEIRHRQPDGTYIVRVAALGDEVQANDVIRVKERIF